MFPTGYTGITHSFGEVFEQYFDIHFCHLLRQPNDPFNRDLPWSVSGHFLPRIGSVKPEECFA